MVPTLLTSAARLRLPGGAVLETRALEADREELVLAPEPGRDDGFDLAELVSMPVQVTLDTADGEIWWDGVVAGTVQRACEALRIRLIGGPHQVERRQSQRVPMDLELEIAPAGETPVAGRLVEVSFESIRVEAPVRMLAGDLAQVVLYVPGEGAIRLTASVVRCAPTDGTVLTFELIPVDRRDGLVRYAFTRLLEAAA